MDRNRAAKASLAAVFLLLLVAFGWHLARVGRSLDAPALRAGLEGTGELLALPEWEVSLFRCPASLSGLERCDPVGEPVQARFPDPPGIEALLSRGEPGDRPNAASVRRAIGDAERAFLSKSRVVTLVFPRSVQRRLRVEVGGQVWETTGIGVSAQVPVASADVLAEGELRASYFFPELPWFGPADQPPALARNESVETYVSLPMRTVFASELPDLLLMGFPLMLVALALVLDHSALFLALSLYGASRAARSLVAVTLTHSTSGTTGSALLAWSHLALDGAVVATLLYFVVTLCSSGRVSKRLLWGALAGFPLAFLIAGIARATPGTGPTLFLKTSGLWADLVSCSFALPLLLVALFRPQPRAPGAISPSDVTRGAGLDHLRPRLALVSVAFAWHLAGAVADLRAIAGGAMRTPFDPAHQVLLPVLILTTLTSVGSVTNRMVAYAALMKGRLEQLLKGTRELATARNQVQAFARALRTAASEVAVLRGATFEIVLPAQEGRLARYLCDGHRAAAGESPLFDGFASEDAFALPRSSRDISMADGRIAFPLWHGEKWKGALLMAGAPRGHLAREDEEFLATLLQGVAITLENLGTLDALERADKLKDEFLANTSHELRTPLTGIIGLAEGLLAQREFALHAGSKRGLSLIVNSARRLANLVGDILDFSKLRENNLDLQRRPTSLAGAVEVAVALCRPLLGGKPVDMRMVLPDPCPPVLADENRLQQILCNLIGNAIKFTETGEIEVTVERQGEARMAVHVRDTGQGIADEFHDAIFKSFVQVVGGDAREHGGTGLGLAVTKRLVELHKGTIVVRSRPGVGSVFTFTLPVSTQPAEGWRQDGEAVGLLQRVIENPVDFRDNETVVGGVIVRTRAGATDGGVGAVSAAREASAMRGAPGTGVPSARGGAGAGVARGVGGSSGDPGATVTIATGAAPSAKRSWVGRGTASGENSTSSGAPSDAPSSVRSDSSPTSADGSPAPSGASGSDTAGSLFGATILVVDDEAINREVLRVQLELEGCIVRLSTTGDDALEALENGDVDLVLLDLMLPRRNGFDVCRAIRAHHEASTLPVILLTAKNQVSDLVTAFEAGANDFLSKPFSRRELVARVRNHLRLARTHIAYARFVPNDLLRMLGKTDIIDVRLGDQVAREMTVLFLDIRGFTRLSESLTAKETFDFLNSYFDTVNPVVVRNRGFIDKYIGDAVLALFPEEPADAVRAAVELLAEVRRFNAEGAGVRGTRRRPAVEIGLGAHCGKIMLGTIGNAERMEGTVISETVNVASRLEGMSKFFGASLVTSLELVDRLGGREGDEKPRWRPIGRVRAKGSSRTLRVVEVFEGDAVDVRVAKETHAPAFAAALVAYEARAFAEAGRGFAAVRDAAGGDAVAAFYAAECKRLEASGVGEDWDGTLHLESK